MYFDKSCQKLLLYKAPDCYSPQKPMLYCFWCVCLSVCLFDSS